MNNLPLKNSINLIIINNTVSTYPVIIVERFFTSGFGWKRRNMDGK